MKSLRSKFIVLILAGVLLSATVIGALCLYICGDVISSDTANVMNISCENETNLMNAAFEEIEFSVKTMEFNAINLLDDVDQLKNVWTMRTYLLQLERIMLNIAKNTQSTVSFYFRLNPDLVNSSSEGILWKRNKSGSFVASVPTDLSAYGMHDEEIIWYWKPIELHKATWIGPYQNNSMGYYMMSYDIPIYIDDVFLGIIGMDVDFRAIEEHIDEIQVLENGYAFLLDAKEQIVYHHDYPIGTAAHDAFSTTGIERDKIRLKSSGNELVSFYENGKKYDAAFRTTVTGSKLFLVASDEELHSTQVKTVWIAGLAALLIAIFFIFIMTLLTNRFIKPLRELTEASKRIANEDLTVNLTYTGDDEVGVLSESFRQTVNHLRRYITHISGMAYRDALTNVKNKRAFDEAKQELNTRIQVGAPEFAVMVFDLNGLKETNDKYGHVLGDSLIQGASDVITKIYKHSPVYRIGGDEFVVILEHQDFADRKALLQDFEYAVSKTTVGDDVSVQLSIAKGMSDFILHSDLSFEPVFERADQEMYENKKAIKSSPDYKI